MLYYFFVPGSKLHKIPDILATQVDEIIIDLEDAVKVSAREAMLESLVQGELQQFYVRIPLYSQDGKLDVSILDTLIEHGYKQFVLPKIDSVSDLDIVFERTKTNTSKIILLIEKSKLLLQLPSAFHRYAGWLTGLGLGSHDLMSELGGTHHLNNLEFPRQQVLYIARALDAIAIDIASMQLKDEKQLQAEIINGVDKGYDAKFYIHPWQVKTAKDIQLYTQEEYEWALQVQKFWQEAGGAAEFDPIVISGEVIERPHLNKAQKIIRYYESK